MAAPQAPGAQPYGIRAAISRDGERYHGFNLLIGGGASAAYASNRASGAEVLAAGIVGLSNHLLDTPWPKVERARDGIEQLLSGTDALRRSSQRKFPG